MKPHEELRHHREAILAGRWVRGHPAQPGQACVVFRVVCEGPDGLRDWAALDAAGIEVGCGMVDGSWEFRLSPMATRALGAAVAEHWELVLAPWPMELPWLAYDVSVALQTWNDDAARTVGDVVAALERAEVIAKEFAHAAA